MKLLKIIFQIRIIFGVIPLFIGKNIKEISEHIKINLKNKTFIKNLEINIKNEILKIKPLMEEISKITENYKIINEKNYIFLVKKHLIFFYINELQNEIEKFKIDFEKIRNTNFFEILEFNKENYLIIIENFMKNYDRNKINVIFNTNIFEKDVLKSEFNISYKYYTRELFNFYFGITKIYSNLYLNQGLIYGNENQKIKAIKNKLNILNKINNIRIKFPNIKLENTNFKNLIFEYIKLDKKNLIKNQKSFKNNEEYFIKELNNNKNIIDIFIIKLENQKYFYDEGNKLIESMNKLEKISIEIDNNIKELNIKNINIKKFLYDKYILNFINRLKIFFIAIHKTIEFIDISYNDYSILITQNILKEILKTKDNFKNKVDYVFKIILNNNFSEKEENEILKKYLNKEKLYDILLNHKYLLKNINNFINLKESFNIDTRTILSFNETLSDNLNKNFNNIFEIIILFNNYLNINNLEIKKKIEFELLKKTLIILIKAFKDNSNILFLIQKKELFNYIVKDSNITDFLIMLHGILYSENEKFNLKIDQIIFSSIILDMFKTIIFIYFNDKTNLLNYLKNDENISDSLKNIIILINKF